MAITPDLVIIGLMVISMLIGVVRGFIKETISLISWGVAIVLSSIFTTSLAKSMTFTSNHMLQMLTAFLLIFVGTIFIGAIVNTLIGSLIRQTPFSVPDRILGACFGLLRGFALVTLLVLLSGLTAFPETPWWKNASLITQFEGPALWLQSQLPKEYAKEFTLPKKNHKEKQ